MKSVHSKAFLNLWRMLYQDSNPGPERSRWSVDDVDWTRETHSFRGRDHALRIETHHLRHLRRGSAGWTLLVVTETWWSASGNTLKSADWCKVVEGQAKHVLGWFDGQRNRLERNLAPAEQF